MLVKVATCSVKTNTGDVLYSTRGGKLLNILTGMKTHKSRKLQVRRVESLASMET